MKKIDFKKRVKSLIALWLFSAFLVSTFAANYRSNLESNAGNDSIALSDGYQLAAIAVIAFYFCPLTVIIHQRAKIAEMKFVVIIARIVFVFHILWLFLYSLLKLC